MVGNWLGRNRTRLGHASGKTMLRLEAVLAVERRRRGKGVSYLADYWAGQTNSFNGFANEPAEALRVREDQED